MKKYVPLLITLLGFVSCFDPTHSDAVDALGPEAPGEREGPRHRPGQPCGVCHNGRGPGPELIVGGTVYERRGANPLVPVQGATIVLTDTNKKTLAMTSNDVGNFFRESEDLSFPLHVEIQYRENGATKSKLMLTRIQRDASCNTCHLGKGDLSHMPAVYLKEPTEP